MTEPVEVIREGERPAFAVLRWEDFERLRGLEEDAADAALAERVLSDPAQDWVPSELVDRMLDEGVHPVRAWREHRGLTLEELAVRAGLNQAHVAGIESRERQGTLAEMRALAEALRIRLDTLAATLD
jgi:ribosome-binding protein aMBF1 (putative translation factor)